MNTGKVFEQQIKKSLPKDIFYLRLNDPAQIFDRKSSLGKSQLRFSLNNPFDMLVFKSPKLYCFELKSTKSNSISYWKDDSCKSAMIKKNQINGLKKAAICENVVAGFILNFRTTEHTYFFKIRDFLRMINHLKKKSFNENDIIDFNATLIKQYKMKVNYKYDMEDLLNKI